MSAEPPKPNSVETQGMGEKLAAGLRRLALVLICGVITVLAFAPPVIGFLTGTTLLDALDWARVRVDAVVQGVGQRIPDVRLVAAGAEPTPTPAPETGPAVSDEDLRREYYRGGYDVCVFFAQRSFGLERTQAHARCNGSVASMVENDWYGQPSEGFEWDD